MAKEEKASVSELLQKLNQRSGARCEGYKLGLDCGVSFTEDSEPLIYHVDCNPRNNEISNLVILCPNCHSRVIELLSEKRRKTYVKKVAQGLGKYYFGNRHSQISFGSATISHPHFSHSVTSDCSLLV